MTGRKQLKIKSGPSRAAALALAVLAIFTLTACGTTVRVNGTEVDNKVPFLATLEQAWRADIADDQHLRTADQTGCWLLRAPDSGELQPRALCGPVRHLRDLGKPGVFDALDFEPRPGDQGEVVLDPDTISRNETGVEPPPGLELYRPDGLKPVAADQVPAPPIPKADPGRVDAGASFQVENGTKPEKGVIIAPGFRLTVDEVGTMARFPSTGDDAFYEPADGEEVRAIRLTRQPDPDFEAGSADVSTSYALRTETGTTELDPVLDKVWILSGNGPMTIMASVPKGADPNLVIKVGGLEQTLSLRTGERTSDTAPAAYREKTSFPVAGKYAGRHTQGDLDVAHEITFTDASVAAFDENRGWAPAGKMWFYLGWEGRRQHDGSGRYLLSYDVGRSFGLKDSAGGQIAISEGNPLDRSSYNDGLIVALAPAETKSVTINYSPRGTFKPGGAYELSPRSGSFAFPAKSFVINFS
ncbi:hypothetical protein [Microlunatus speluncae]|uniref:hypothetical protein n=1 Tax=Microlunatus speluncae TaxID=2594267 RepID=UPI0012664735|nr:hypothetical protein [Microlunatus speluncae]